MEKEKLVKEFIRLKKKEAEFKSKRLDVESELLELYKAELPEKGSKTSQVGDFKLTMKTGLKYTVDVDALRNADIPEDMLPVKLQPAKYVFDPKAYEAIVSEGGEVANEVMEHVTVTPMKTSFSIKVRYCCASFGRSDTVEAFA